MEVIQVIGNSDRGITLDSEIFDMEAISADDAKQTLSLDISLALKMWLQFPDTNHGLKLSLPPGTNLLDNPLLVVELRHIAIKMRPKREVRKRDWRRKIQSTILSNDERSRIVQRKCNRKRMTISLCDIPGFSFIYQPVEFEASYCAGTCPVK